jgi:hypothetical protein
MGGAERHRPTQTRARRRILDLNEPGSLQEEKREGCC